MGKIILASDADNTIIEGSIGEWYRNNSSSSSNPKLKQLVDYIDKNFPKRNSSFMYNNEILLVDAERRDDFNTEICLAMCGGFVYGARNTGYTVQPSLRHFIELNDASDSYDTKGLYARMGSYMLGYDYIHVYIKAGYENLAFGGSHDRSGYGFNNSQYQYRKEGVGKTPNGERLVKHTFSTRRKLDTFYLQRYIYEYGHTHSSRNHVFVHKITLSRRY